MAKNKQSNLIVCVKMLVNKYITNSGRMGELLPIISFKYFAVRPPQLFFSIKYRLLRVSLIEL